MANSTESRYSSNQTAPKSRRKTIADEQSRMGFALGAYLVGLLLRFWVRRYRAIGVDRVPSSGGVFLICNHTSAMDPFLLGYPIRKYTPSGPGKVELFRNPIVAYIMRKLGIFPLRQDRADMAAVKAMLELYRSGRIVIVYPEGGRSDSGEMREFMPDFARLMIRLKATVVPAAIVGANDVLPIGSKLPRRNTPVVVVFGDPLDLSAFWGRAPTPEAVKEAAHVMQHSVKMLLSGARGERDRMQRR